VIAVTTHRRRWLTLATALVLTAVASAWAQVTPASAANRTFVGVSTTAAGQGYVLTADTGETYAFGQVAYRGNPTSFTGKIVGIATTADGQGYVAVSSAGQVYAFGSVAYRGNPTEFLGPIAAIAVTADGQGYVVVSSAGQVYAYGSVAYRGNPTSFTGQIVGISVTADGQGYVAVSSAGQVYAYGSVGYRGNPEGFTGQITGVSATADGQGYVAVSSAGQVYAFGSVAYHGNPAGFNGQVAGISTTADGQGYAAMSSSGQVYAYGPVVYRGNGDPVPTTPPPAPPGPPSSLRERIVARGLSQNGVTENPLGSNCNPYGPCEQWCADFVSWAWRNEGVTMPRQAAVGGLWGWATGHTRAATDRPEIGDAIVYSTTSERFAHTGIVSRVLPDGQIATVEGNAGGAVDTPRGRANVAVVVSVPHAPELAFRYGRRVYGYASPVPLPSGARTVAAAAAAPPPPSAAEAQQVPVDDLPAPPYVTAALKSPAYQHMPYRARGVKIDYTGSTKTFKVRVLVRYTTSKSRAQRVYRRFLRRYHDTGKGYVVRYRRSRRL
jgi:hypothetical protein